MKVLVGYASGYGSTKSYAEVIVEELSRAGHETDVFPAQKVRDLAFYDFVVIGGSIRAGTWLGPAVRLTKRAVKAGKRHAVFFCCLAAQTEEGKQKVFGEYFDKVKEKVPGLAPLAIGAFPGVANYAEYRFPVKGIMTGIAKKEGVDISVNQDYRELETARDWARELVQKMG
ncbi:MAG TPA: flavodoxin domain-containing protein [bacterium]|nr:flavodoxin domain-containing protein [bacterium]